MKNSLLAFLLLTTSAISNAASVNLVVNGSFEDSGPGINSWAVYQTIPGWKTISGPGIEIRNNVVGTTEFGKQFVELDSHNSSRNANSTMEQIISTSIGTLYNLSFYYSPRINQSSTTNGISVFWNDTLLKDISVNGGNVNIWTFHQFIVTGTGSDSLKFSATGISDTLGGNIDNVSVNAVPVPAAAWLFVSALGLFGFTNRRKNT